LSRLLDRTAGAAVWQKVGKVGVEAPPRRFLGRGEGPLSRVIFEGRRSVDERE